MLLGFMHMVPDVYMSLVFPLLKCELFYFHAGLCTGTLSTFGKAHVLSYTLPPLPWYLPIKYALLHYSFPEIFL